MPGPQLKPPTGNFNAPPPEVALAFQERTNQGSTCTWIFEVNYAINSKHPRFFLFNVQTGNLYQYKCAHGRGGRNENPHDGVCREVSNDSGSGCSSLGAIRTLALYTSTKVGRALRLDGLSTTNSHIEGRGVVLHGSDYVFDNDASTDTQICGRSLGCIVISDQYVHHADGGQLLEVLAGGSIGVTHFNGNFHV